MTTLAALFPEYILDTATALGIAVLAVPVFSLNLRKRKLTTIEQHVDARSDTGDSKALDVIASELKKDATDNANRWRKIDQTCLRLGYALLLGASIIRIFV